MAPDAAVILAIEKYSLLKSMVMIYFRNTARLTTAPTQEVHAVGHGQTHMFPLPDKDYRQQRIDNSGKHIQNNGDLCLLA